MHVPDSPVWDALRVEIADNPGRINAAALWIAMGRPPDQAPPDQAPPDQAPRDLIPAADIPDDADGPAGDGVIVGTDASLRYAETVDRGIVTALDQAVIERFRADPMRARSSGAANQNGAAMSPIQKQARP